MESVVPTDMSDAEFVEFVKAELVTMILSLHDISSKRRRQSRLLLRRICERSNSNHQLQEFLVSTTIACLAGASETIKAGVIESLGLYAYVLEECEELKDRFVGIILLLEVSSPQIARSLLKFVRLAIQGCANPETVQKCFAFFIKSILDSDMARSACRVRIRTLIEKLGKKFGWNDLEKKIPENHIRLFRYTRRMYNRRVRKAVARDSKDDLLDSDNDDEDDSDMDEIEERKQEQIVMIEGGDNPVDLLSNQVQFARKRVSQSTPPAKLSSDGRIVVDDDEMIPPQAPAKKTVSLSDLAELRDKFNALRKAKVAEKTATGGKKSSSQSEQVNKRNRRKHELVGLSQYAPRKANAFGDAKRSEQDTDPFAYVRLNPSLIREKYKGNAISSLSQVIKKTGEKASRKRKSFGRSGIDGSMFVQKPVFKNKRLVSATLGKQKKN